MANGGIIGPVNDPTAAIPEVRTTKTASGSHVLQPTTSEIEILLVAGGGGIGVYAGGPGGGGGVKYYGSATGLTDPNCGTSGAGASTKTANGAAIPVTGGATIPITIGAGGAPAPETPPAYGRGNPGSNTTATIEGTPYSTTGGGGGGGASPTQPGLPGGSGGGSSQPPGGTAGTGVPGEGNPGGSNTSPHPTFYTGGGGGATQPGFPNQGTYGVMGGAGAGYDIADGSTIVYYGGGNQAESGDTSPSARYEYGRTAPNPSGATGRFLNSGQGGGYGGNSPVTPYPGPSGTGSPGVAIIYEPGRSASAPGVWSLQEQYNFKKQGTWTG